MAVAVEELLERARSYLQPDKLAVVEAAYRYAAEKHQGQRRMSGEPYIQHPLRTALYLAELNLDAVTLAAALLHDVMEDCGVARTELEERFGSEAARLVDGVTKLAKIDRLKGDGLRAEEHQRQAESTRKMLVAMAEDIRVVLIKLADRLHNMETLGALPEEERRRIAQETLDIYAPLAHRLGISEVKWRLEDLAFRHLYPSQYRKIARLLAARREEREVYIERVCGVLRGELERAGIKAEVYGRPKHLYSIFQKMQKYAEQGKDFGQIQDLYATRVLVTTKADCYHALGLVHDLWHPLPGQFDDYIANPKENLYQSLHTSVMCESGTPLEVQIRTHEMHQINEYGVAAHWRYKEGGASGDMRFEDKIAWLRQLLEWQREMQGAEEFLESVKADIFQDQVFVYTPKGVINELPAGATPLDFAYLVHTELGHRCMGAKVNGKLVSFDYQLQNGDTVEVATSKVARGPSLDWLNPELGYLRTAGAIRKVRQWFRHQERSANIARGRDTLQKELKRLGLVVTEEEIARHFKYENLDDFLDALGSGSVSVAQIGQRLAPEPEAPAPAIADQAPLPGPSSGVQVMGVGDLLTNMGQCCNPLPGDDIVGFVTRNRGVTVHRRDCPNIRNEDEPERIVRVNWGPAQQVYPVRVRIAAWDRVGLLRDVTTLVSSEKVNIASVVTTEHSDGTAIITLTVHVTGIVQLSRLFAKLEHVTGVLSLSRANEPATIQPKVSKN
ncbi:MAG: bifunctional (p)ppGpp synthetase/guanosine-3',5'-bis(diphosphate) 3'-pyrophosphohydrolase [Chloroflexi bacterium]|nr:bifunctional (p)ppGpp synthetase/guanosine-3',5'-bis(diphosphate) 3'-pyrophosphohydrolase [Chloroflexota bacterium]